MKKKGEITSYPIMIKRELWEAWKKTIPRDISLNEALINLVERDLEEKGKAKEAVSKRGAGGAIG